MNADLDNYFEEQKNRKEELNRLRSIVLKADLKEELKWNAPCYTFQNKNVCMIFNFKNSFGVSFFKGSFINDSYEILEKPGDNTLIAPIGKRKEAGVNNQARIHQRKRPCRSLVHRHGDLRKASARPDRR